MSRWILVGVNVSPMCVDCAKRFLATVPFRVPIRLIPETIQVYWRESPLCDLIGSIPCLSDC